MQRASPAPIVRPAGGPAGAAATVITIITVIRVGAEQSSCLWRRTLDGCEHQGREHALGAVGAKTGRVRDKKRLGVPLSLRDGGDNASWAWNAPDAGSPSASVA
jgi:hypothetical protein